MVFLGRVMRDRVVPLGESLLPVHDRSRMRLQVFSDFRMILHILLQLRMIGDEFWIVHQVRVLMQLLPQFRMLPQELAELRNSATNVAKF